MTNSGMVAVTGGIGTGKSAALDAFSQLGAATVSADRVVHTLYEAVSDLARLIAERWGEQALAADGSVDRQYLAQTVFASAAERAELNRMVHPRVWEQLEQRAAATDGMLFCEIPLLFEVGWQDRMACVVTVYCTESVQRRRLGRRGVSAEDIERRRVTQLPMETKVEQSDIVLVNNGSRSLLRRQCRHAYATIVSQT